MSTNADMTLAPEYQDLCRPSATHHRHRQRRGQKECDYDRSRGQLALTGLMLVSRDEILHASGAWSILTGS